MFNEFTSGNIRSTYPSTNGFVRADPRNMSKTNPMPIKGKAVDLENQTPTINSQAQSPTKLSSAAQRLSEMKAHSSALCNTSPKIHKGIPNPNNPYG